ncbi:MAG: hypothetical protein ACRD06_08005, partial [Terriglobia bacterium]
MLDRRQKILAIARAAEATFSSSEWTELGYLTGVDQWIDAHPRLLRSLSFRDDDYKRHVLGAVAHILDSRPGNLRQLVEYRPIAMWLTEHERGAFEEMCGEVFGTEVADAAPRCSTDAGL